MMQQTPLTFSSNGKLLLTGEYLVLSGAKALALPLIKTQSLEIIQEESSGHALLSWYAFGPQTPWLKLLFELPGLDIINTSDRQKSIKLQMILLTLKQLNPDIFDGKHSYTIKTRLDFEPEWGLGTSSTLIANLAKWAKVDPYALLQFSIGGSGYDIACANASAPVIFQLNHMKPLVSKAPFKPPFADKLFFVYRGHKKDSTQGIRDFQQLTEDKDLTKQVNQITAITEAVGSTPDFDAFCELMNQHEAILSEILGLPPLKEQFPDFDGHVKNLGAWGGDFMLVMTQKDEAWVRRYFKDKASDILFTYAELVRS
jgi:mevalonate kinase